MGRPSKLTKEVQKKIETAIAGGNYYEAACNYAGIDYQTFRNWIKAGEEVASGEKRKTKNSKKYLEFFEVVQAAEARAEVRIVAQWQRQIPNNWQAARDFLARRFPDRWKPRDEQELVGEGSQVHIYIPDNGRGDSQ